MSHSYIVYTGPHTLDLSPSKGKLYDMEEGGVRGLRPDLQGFSLVVLELEQSYPTCGASAGIAQDVYDHFVSCNTMVDTIDEQLVTARKQVEVLEESRAIYVDMRQNDLAIMGDSMKSRAHRRKDNAIIAPFETTLAYVAQIGDKAAKTRKQNAAKAKEEREAAEAQAEAQAELDAELQAKLNAYKAELEAKFNDAVKEAAKKLVGETQMPPIPPRPEVPQAI